MMGRELTFTNYQIRSKDLESIAQSIEQTFLVDMDSDPTKILVILARDPLRVLVR